MEVGYVGNAINYSEIGWKDWIVYPLKVKSTALTLKIENDHANK